jgi:hypothetical protein
VAAERIVLGFRFAEGITAEWLEGRLAAAPGGGPRALAR